MSRSGKNYGKKPPDIGLQMECHDEALTPEQVAAYNQGEKEYKEATEKLEQMMKTMGAEVLNKSEYAYVLQMNIPGPQTPVAAPGPIVPKPVATVQPPVPAQTIANNRVQPIQPAPGPVILQGSAQSLTPKTSTTYQLMMDPQLGLVVGTVTSGQSTPGTPTAQSKSVANTTVASSTPPPVQTRSAVTTRTSVRGIAPAAPPPPVTPTVPSLRIRAPKPIKPSPPPPTKVNSRPTEGNSIGGLSTGPGSKPWKPPAPSTSNAPLVDLTDDDKPGGNVADSREVTFNKLSGKTFPSLVVIARPHLRVRDMAQSVVSQERGALDSKVKSVLMFTPTKFTEWLIQQGLVRSEQCCSTHVLADNVTPIKLKLGMYSDVSKFPYSGGYVWISECCPQRFVSVFSGSIFEGAPHPPTVLLKLIYHWACQTNVQNVVQWVKVDNFYVKNFFTNMRSVCTAAIHEKYEKMGGPRKRIEVGVISLGTTSQDGNMRQVKVEVLGVMDPESKLIRLRAVEPLQQEGERNYKRRFIKILEPLEQWVEKDSIILTDFTVDKGTLHNMGFSSVYQVSVSENPTPQNKYSNQNVMDYLRRIVPRMFQNTLSLLSRQIIQQFLDELVWRERWGPVASQAFDNIIAHMAEQTKLETSDSLLMRLSKVAGNPFKHWNYESWKTPPPPRTPLVANGTEPVQEPVEPDLPPPLGPISSIDMLPQSIRTVDPPPAPPSVGKRGRKRQVVVSEAPEPKKAAPSPVPPPEPEEMIQLDPYYYGTLEGSAELIEEETKNTLAIKCCMCPRKYTNNIALMKHLIQHAQVDNQFSTELSDVTQCKYCLKTFPTPFSMQSHIEEIHLKQSSSLVCRICEEKFRDKSSLIWHMHRFHVAVELPYECGVCNFRSSIHRDLIDHFYDVHGGGEKLQCPFCLKIVAFANNGKRMSANVHFFLNHIMKHQRKTIARKCEKCALWFVHKGILKEHQFRDHSSFKGMTGVKPYVTPPGMEVIMMPPPPKQMSGPLNARGKREKQKPPSTNYLNVKFEPPLVMYGVQNGAVCCECEGDFLCEDHFPGYLTCSRCRFATCCSKAMAEHTVVFHEPSKSVNFTLGRAIQLPTDMFCVCGFKTSSGNRLANHLAKCERKSAYPSPTAAKAATIQSASFPPLVTLDDADNPSEDPSDRWLKAFVPSRKEDTGDGSRDAPDKKQTPQAGGESGDPPSMLNILGLVRKPSTDESSLDRAPSDSEGPSKQDGKSEVEAAEVPADAASSPSEGRMEVDEPAPETEEASPMEVEENSESSEPRAASDGENDGEVAPSLTSGGEKKPADTPDEATMPALELAENTQTENPNASYDEDAVPPLLEENATSQAVPEGTVVGSDPGCPASLLSKVCGFGMEVNSPIIEKSLEFTAPFYFGGGNTPIAAHNKANATFSFGGGNTPIAAHNKANATFSFGGGNTPIAAHNKASAMTSFGGGNTSIAAHNKANATFSFGGGNTSIAAHNKANGTIPFDGEKENKDIVGNVAGVSYALDKVSPRSFHRDKGNGSIDGNGGASIAPSSVLGGNGDNNRNRAPNAREGNRGRARDRNKLEKDVADFVANILASGLKVNKEVNTNKGDSPSYYGRFRVMATKKGDKRFFFNSKMFILGARGGMNTVIEEKEIAYNAISVIANGEEDKVRIYKLDDHK